jgi:hypothetical protein
MGCRENLKLSIIAEPNSCRCVTEDSGSRSVIRPELRTISIDTYDQDVSERAKKSISNKESLNETGATLSDVECKNVLGELAIVLKNARHTWEEIGWALRNDD